MAHALLRLLVLALTFATLLPADALARNHFGGYHSSGGHQSSTYHAPRTHTYHAPTYHAPKAHTAKPPKTHWHVPSSGGHHAQPGDSPYRQYRREVDRLSNENYRRNRAQIDPAHMRGKRGHMDLDHRTPVKQCFDRGIPAAQCADPGNLRMLDAHQNRSEGCRGCKKGK